MDQQGITKQDHLKQPVATKQETVKQPDVTKQQALRMLETYFGYADGGRQVHLFSDTCTL